MGYGVHGGLAWQQLTKNRKKGWGSGCNYGAFIINQMKLLEAAGVMCVVIQTLHASHQHAHTHATHSLSLPCFHNFFLVKVRWVCKCLCVSVCICMYFHVCLYPPLPLLSPFPTPLILWLDICLCLCFTLSSPCL